MTMQFRLLTHIIVTSIIFLHFSALHAQEQHNAEQLIRSPQVADMMRFDKVGNVSKLSGRLDLDIELARIKDNDFDLPVTIRYNSAGFMPSSAESYVGLNWSLSTGGAIIREVKGVPDDIISYSKKPHQYFFLDKNKGHNPEHYYWEWPFNKWMSFETDTWTRGFTYFLKQKGVFPNNIALNNVEAGYEKASAVLKYSYLESLNKSLRENEFVEANSDIYHFHFGDHSGKFMINFDGSVKVVSNNGGQYAVDLSDYHIYSRDDPYAVSSIRIITDDGYTYSFGGSYDNVEYTYSWSNPTEGSIRIGTGIKDALEILKFNLEYDTRASISSYHLSKIEAPNGRILNVEYLSVPSQLHTGMIGYLCATKYDQSSSYAKSLMANRQNFIASWHPTHVVMRRYTTNSKWDDPIYESDAPLHNLTKVALVSRIRTDSQEITFNYTPAKSSPFQKLYSSTSYGNVSGHHWFEINTGAELQNIVLSSYTDKGTTHEINKAILNYSTWDGTSGERRLLSSLNISTIGQYTFSYNTLMPLPSPLTANVDFWNYWRGGTYDPQRAPLPIPDHYFEGVKLFYGNSATHQETQETLRSPLNNGIGVDCGMLKGIVFPTGGKIEIEYESHEYNYYIRMGESTGSVIPMLAFNGVHRKAGGVRVKRIIRDGLSTLYLYRNSVDKQRTIGGGYESSGILMSEPILADLFPVIKGKYVTYDDPFVIFEGDVNAAGFNTQSYEEDHMRYSTVIEVTGNVREDSNGIVPIPNGYTKETFIGWSENPDNLSTEFSHTDFTRESYDGSSLCYYFQPTDKSYMRNKPKSLEVYDAKRRLIKEDKYLYSEPKSSNIQTTYFYHQWGKLRWRTRNNDDILPYTIRHGVQKVPVELGWRPLIKKTSTEYFYDSPDTKTPSSQVTREEEYNYSGSNRPYLYLQEKKTTNSDKSVWYDIYTYSYEQCPWMVNNHNLSNAIVQHEVKKNGRSISVQKNNYTTKNLGGNRSMPVLSSQEQTVNGISEVRTRFLQYNRYGNPVHVEIDGRNVFYLWSYKNEYPIAEIVGCSDFSIFQNAVRQSFGKGIDEVSDLFEVSNESLNALRNHQTLSKASITTALYRPLVGVLEITDSMGRTTHYDYYGSDKGNHLKEIRDDKNNPINEYKYKYFNQ